MVRWDIVPEEVRDEVGQDSSRLGSGHLLQQRPVAAAQVSKQLGDGREGKWRAARGMAGAGKGQGTARRCPLEERLGQRGLADASLAGHHDGVEPESRRVQSPVQRSGLRVATNERPGHDPSVNPSHGRRKTFEAPSIGTCLMCEIGAGRNVGGVNRTAPSEPGRFRCALSSRP